MTFLLARPAMALYGSAGVGPVGEAVGKGRYLEMGV